MTARIPARLQRAPQRGAAALCVAAAALLQAPPVAAKPPICGLVTMGRIGFQLRGGAPDNRQTEAWTHPDLYSGLVVNLRWSDLEPSPGVYRFEAVDAALSDISKYNDAHPGHPVRAKLRVVAGRHAPDWAVAASGGAVQLVATRVPIAVGRFWTPAYRNAWRGLQAALAARYDADPRIGEVAISSCATMSDEPFILPISPENLAALHAAGFSDAAFRSCLSGAVDDYAGWKQTPLDFTFNIFRASDNGRPRPDPDFTVGLMTSFRGQLGARAVLATHGLNRSVAPVAEPIYAALRRLGPPIAFQFYAPELDFSSAVANGAAYSPTELEVWQSRDAGGLAQESADDLAGWRRMLACGRPG